MHTPKHIEQLLERFSFWTWTPKTTRKVTCGAHAWICHVILTPFSRCFWRSRPELNCSIVSSSTVLMLEKLSMANFYADDNFCEHRSSPNLIKGGPWYCLKFFKFSNAYEIALHRICLQQHQSLSYIMSWYWICIRVASS